MKTWTLKTNDRLSFTCIKHILQFLCHNSRRDPDCLEKLMVLDNVVGGQGCVEDNQPDEVTIRNLTGARIQDSYRSAQDRSALDGRRLWPFVIAILRHDVWMEKNMVTIIRHDVWMEKNMVTIIRQFVIRKQKYEIWDVKYDIWDVRCEM